MFIRHAAAHLNSSPLIGALLKQLLRLSTIWNCFRVAQVCVLNQRHVRASHKTSTVRTTLDRTTRVQVQHAFAEGLCATRAAFAEPCA
jgi:hypothetical protein